MPGINDDFGVVPIDDSLEPGKEYSLIAETRAVLQQTVALALDQIPPEVVKIIPTVVFQTDNRGIPYFPVPFKESETIGALKAIEAATAAAIADLRYSDRRRRITVDLDRATCFAMSAYLAEVNGHWKQDSQSKQYLKDTDLLQAQSVLYRRLASNLYETRTRGEFYHIHGSLEATSTLNMIGLEGHRPDMTSYRECINLIEDHVKRFSVDELEVLNSERRQAGVPALKWEEFVNSKHGQIMVEEPPWTVDNIEKFSPPAPFPGTSVSGPGSQVLTGIKVLELCRIIAGPSIGRGLAELGADVLKVTSPNLSDVPFFQVDGNTGKHTTDLDLHDPADRATFESLLMETDIVIDGYRPGSLERLGYGPFQIADYLKSRNRGFIYVAEDCFGHEGEWATRPGWQQIADCVTGIAWKHGQFMGLDEPVVPPFPMSDYGCGCLGVIAALSGIYKRGKWGGSYLAKTSIVQYDILLNKLGTYPEAILDQLRLQHDADFFELKHHDSVDEVGKRALKSMRRVHPELVLNPIHFHESFSEGFGARVKFVKPVTSIEGMRVGFQRASRPNGYDKSTWDLWEIDDALSK